MIAQPMVITLIGSTRFEPLFGLWTEALTVCAGHAVFDLAVRGKTSQDWYDADTRERLVASRRLKIQRSDAVLLLDYGGYMGGLSTEEWVLAQTLGKVRYRLANAALLLPNNGIGERYKASLQSWQPPASGAIADARAPT